MDGNSIQNESIRIFCRLGIFLDLRVLDHFTPLGYFWAWGYWDILGSKIKEEKFLKLTNVFEIYIIHKKSLNILV